jgi:3-oxoacyl-[acyl-carrier-protein] synthase II
MVMKACITGWGWVNSTGRGQGRKDIFRPGSGDGPLKLAAKGIFDKPVLRYGRMDDYSKLGLLAIALALKDAHLDQWTEMRNIAVIASTVNGCLQTDVDYFDTVMPEGGRLASPNLFAYTLPNTYIGEAAICFGITGASFIIHEPSLSGYAGLLLAMECLSNHDCEAVVVGVCDILPPQVLGLKSQAVPGALFVVLRKEEATQNMSYGTLIRDNSGSMFYEGKEVGNLQDLAVWCTKSREL